MMESNIFEECTLINIIRLTMLPQNFESQINTLKEIILQKYKEKKSFNSQKSLPTQRLMVGICGVPGSGKSTVSQRLK